MTRTFRVAVACACVALMSVAANAATVTYGPSSFGLFSAGASGGFTMPSFDTTLGTLFQVDLDVTGSTEGGSNSLQNLSNNPGTATVTIGTNVTVTGPSLLQVLTFPQSSNTGPVTAFVGPILDFSGTDSIQVFGTPAFDTDSSSIFAGFAPFQSVGPGLVNFNYGSAANTASNADVAPTVSGTTAPFFGFDATITYHYNPVPEPTTLALAGLGAIGLVVVAARRKRIAG
jgi:hypothetical protein